MTISSAQENYSTILNETIKPVSFNWHSDSYSTGFSAQTISTVLPSSVTSNISAGGYTGSSIGSITITNGGSAYTTTAGTTYTVSDSWNSPVFRQEFVNCMPDFARIEKMCKEYHIKR